jgi:hypothetical protein
MLIRVATRDLDSAQRLVASLIGHFGDEHVSLQVAGDVHVQLNGDSGQRAMAATFSSVERWLDETGAGSTDVWVDGRQYRLEV